MGALIGIAEPEAVAEANGRIQTVQPSVETLPRDHVPNAAPWVLHVPRAPGYQVEVAVIDRLPGCHTVITAPRSSLGLIRVKQPRPWMLVCCYDLHPCR